MISTAQAPRGRRRPCRQFFAERAGCGRPLGTGVLRLGFQSASLNRLPCSFAYLMHRSLVAQTTTVGGVDLVLACSTDALRLVTMLMSSSLMARSLFLRSPGNLPFQAARLDLFPHIRSPGVGNPELVTSGHIRVLRSVASIGAKATSPRHSRR
jgi:hypothetical protein